MGVVYKLKPQIVEHVVEQKKKNPSLSCRAISALVKESFGTRLSKSSISNILKDANLSSPIGRRGGLRKKKPGSKTFKIAEIKKQAMFSDASKQPILNDLERVRKEDALIDGVGAIFLKAAEWEISRQPILQELIRNCSLEKDPKRIREVAAILGFLKAFQIESVEGLAHYKGKGLWALNGINKALTEVDVLDVVDNLQDRQEFFLKFSLKAPGIFTRAAGFRYVLKDGSTFFLDGQSASVWKNFQNFFSVSLSKATDCLAKILNNTQTEVFCSISPRENRKLNQTNHTFDFIQAFENIHPKKIQRIELLGEDGQILSDFDEIPQIQRSFIAGVWPWEKIFHIFLETPRIREEGSLKAGLINREISFKEAVVRIADGRNLVLRGILLYESFVRVPFLILLTGGGAVEMPPGDVISEYFQRWPNMEKGSSYALISNPSRLGMDFVDVDTEGLLWNVLLGGAPSGRDPVWKAADQLGVLLDFFTRKQFFPRRYLEEDFFVMRNRFYSLPGKIQEDEKKVQAEICVPDGFPCSEDLFLAVRQLNESGITTFDGQRVYLKIRRLI